jgi:hypothetical protein
MTSLQVLSLIFGLLLVAIVFYDLFQTVVLPRPAVRKVQLGTVIVRPLWLAWRWIGRRGSQAEASEARLGAFGPIALLILFALWALALILGYGLVIDGLAEQFRPAPQDFATSIYISSSTLVPLSFGDFVPDGGAARFVIVAESATGVALAALAITLLFSLYESFRAREEMVVSLDALAGAPPSGVHILETAAELRMRPELKDTFEEWRKWSAMVLESHLAYPLLVYFRSSHDNEAWVNSFGAVMDAAVLVMSTVEDDSVGAARLMFTVGNHLVEDLSWVFRFKSSSEPIVERAEWQLAVELLIKAGYKTRDLEPAWKKFVELRSKYATSLNRMAQLLSIPPAQWIGDRSYLPHREGRGRLRRRKQPARGGASS